MVKCFNWKIDSHSVKNMTTQKAYLHHYFNIIYHTLNELLWSFSSHILDPFHFRLDSIKFACQSHFNTYIDFNLTKSILNNKYSQKDLLFAICAYIFFTLKKNTRRKKLSKIQREKRIEMNEKRTFQVSEYWEVTKKNTSPVPWQVKFY